MVLLHSVEKNFLQVRINYKAFIQEKFFRNVHRIKLLVRYLYIYIDLHKVNECMVMCINDSSRHSLETSKNISERGPCTRV